MGFLGLDKPDYMIAVQGVAVLLTGQLLLSVQICKKATNRSYTASEFLIWAADAHGNFQADLERF